MNTILKFPGGKWRIADWIISFFPEHKVYCEPYFGSGAIFFNKQPVYTETINDIDGDIYNLFMVCRNYPLELAKEINLTLFSREEFQRCNERSDNPVEQARRTLVRYHQSFGTSNSSLNSWRNVQTYGGPRCATMWNYLPEAIIKCCERLKQAQIENIDGIELLKHAKLSFEELYEYIDERYGYAWHISNLIIYDEPKELSKFRSVNKKMQKECKFRCRYHVNPDLCNGTNLLAGFACNRGAQTEFCRPEEIAKCECFTPIKKPPQSWCYVEPKIRKICKPEFCKYFNWITGTCNGECEV